jgi:hypothetical protein
MPKRATSRNRMKPITQDTIAVNWKDRVVTASGLNPGLLIIIVLLLWFAAQFINRLIDTPTVAVLEKVVTSISSEHKVLHQDHAELVETQKRLADSVEINTFLNSKSDADKRRYILDEPPALRRMRERD